MRITPAASGDSAEENSSQQSPYISEMSSSSCAREDNHKDRDHPRTQSMRSARVRNALRRNGSNNINESFQKDRPRSGSTSEHSVCNDGDSGGTGDKAWSCPRICIDNLEQHNPLVTVQDAKTSSKPKEECPVIRLSLRKPKHWKLKLTTSASSPAILLPIIHLVDERGDVLVNTRGKSDTFTSTCSENGSGDDNDRTWHGLKNSVRCSRSTSSLYSRKKLVNSEPTVGRSFLERVEEDDLSPWSGALLQEGVGNKSDSTVQPNRHNKALHRRKVSPYTSELDEDNLSQRSGTLLQEGVGNKSDPTVQPNHHNKAHHRRKVSPYTSQLDEEDNLSQRSGTLLQEGVGNKSDPTVQPNRHNKALHRRKASSHTSELDEDDNLSQRSGALLQEGVGNKSDPTVQPNRHNKAHHRRKASSHTSEYGSFYEVPRYQQLVNSKQSPDRRVYYSSDDNTKVFKQHFNAENNTRLKALSKAKGNLFLASCGNPSGSSSSSSAESCLRKRRKVRTSYDSKGDRLLEINSQPLSSYREATQLLRTGSDVVHLKLLRRHHSGPYSKTRHDSLTASPAAARRSKRRQRPGPVDPLAMGSNVSRHSEKGLSGRRTQSSGNLCNGNKILAPTVGRILVPCSGGVGAKDRNKFCGSLPNHLDSNDSPGEGEPCCMGNNNNYDHLQKIHSGLAAPVVVLSNQVNNHRNEVELRLHSLLPHHDLTALHDQGYGSERSPEDEHLPPLPEPDPELKPPASYPFITPEATFSVFLLKGSRGLGLSVTGGIDSGEQWPGLIRIKRLFPHQPAWQSGQLSQGDILLAANGVQLTGLTNYQALEVLRTTPNNVVLVVCRPPNEVFCILPPSEPPPPPIRDPAHSILSSSRNILPLPPIQTDPCGEFDILLTKVNRSLGFTLRKEDESVLGHYVRALVREPALSDGRIRPGDKIVAVNDVDISPMSHEEAVMFLRQCGDHVKLRLYRDAAQTPVSALSPSDETKPFKPKPLLRKEAMDMLCDLAVRKLSPGDSSNSSYGKLRRVSDGQSSSPCSSPRRRRLTKTPSPDTQSDRHGQKYLVTSHVANSDSSGEGSQNNTFTYPSSLDSTAARGHGSSFGSEEGPDTRPQRPNFLDLCGGSGLPSSSRKQPFTFTVSGSEEEETVGPITSTSSEDCVGCLPTEPTSMPPLTNLSSTSSTSTAFSYRNPAYQSANPGYCGHARKSSEEAVERSSDQDIPAKMFDSQSGADGSRGLLKWKGVVFTPDNNEEEESMPSQEVETRPAPSQEPGDEVMMVELSRGWNSRLGFSLQADGHHTYISAVYADSVAAKDGRLQAGDQVLMVNDENVEEMSTAEIIDLLRKIRGTIGITILRKSGPNLQVS